MTKQEIQNVTPRSFLAKYKPIQKQVNNLYCDVIKSTCGAEHLEEYVRVYF